MRNVFLLAAVVLAGCHGGGTEPTPPVPTIATVVIEPGSVSLDAFGATTRLVATARDKTGAELPGKTFAWSSDASTIASVDASGLVTAAANGQATIHATVDGINGTAVVLVSQSVASIEVTPASKTLDALEAQTQLTAVALDANEHPIAGKPITWSSANEMVARVTSAGLVTAKGNGTVSINAAAGSVTGAASIVVRQVPVGLAFTVQPTGRKVSLPLAPAVEVTERDANGFKVADATDHVTLSLGANPSAAALGGTRTVAAVGGVARFADLTIDRTGAYTLIASADALGGATSDAFPIGSCPCAYVPSNNSNSVTVIEQATGMVIGTIPVGASPSGIAATPNGNRVYVTNALSNSISVIETALDEVVATIPMDFVGGRGGPVGIGITPDGARAYVANRFAFSYGPISVISTATNTVLGDIAVSGVEPVGVAVAPNGAFVYVTSQTSGTVEVIETATNSQIAMFSVGGNAYEIAFAPDGAHAYVTSTPVNNIVNVVKTADHTVERTLPVPAFGLAVSPDGAYLYASGEDRVWKISTSDYSIVATITVPRSPTSRSAIVITTDGKFAYRTAGIIPGTSSVNVIDLSSNTVVATIPVGQVPTGIVLTP